MHIPKETTNDLMRIILDRWSTWRGNVCNVYHPWPDGSTDVQSNDRATWARLMHIHPASRATEYHRCTTKTDRKCFIVYTEMLIDQIRWRYQAENIFTCALYLFCRPRDCYPRVPQHRLPARGRIACDVALAVLLGMEETLGGSHIIIEVVACSMERIYGGAREWGVGEGGERDWVWRG